MARNIHKVKHKNVANYYEIYEDEDQFYVVQELMLGPSLAYLINSKKIKELS